METSRVMLSRKLLNMRSVIEQISMSNKETRRFLQHYPSNKHSKYISFAELCRLLVFHMSKDRLLEYDTIRKAIRPFRDQVKRILQIKGRNKSTKTVDYLRSHPQVAYSLARTANWLLKQL